MTTFTELDNVARKIANAMSRYSGLVPNSIDYHKVVLVSSLSLATTECFQARVIQSGGQHPTVIEKVSTTAILYMIISGIFDCKLEINSLKILLLVLINEYNLNAKPLTTIKN